MAKFRMFRADDRRDGKSQIWIIRNSFEVACLHGKTNPAQAKRLAIVGALSYSPLAMTVHHIHHDQRLLDEWEIAE